MGSTIFSGIGIRTSFWAWKIPFSDLIFSHILTSSVRRGMTERISHIVFYIFSTYIWAVQFLVMSHCSLYREHIYRWHADAQNPHQNDGTMTLFASSKGACLSKCTDAYPYAKACEWSGFTCVLHTLAIGRGGGYDGYSCWVFSKCQQSMILIN